MNNYNSNLEEEQKEQGIKVELNTINDLRIAGQWGKLLAVMGFIFIAMMLLFGLLFMLFPLGDLYDEGFPFSPYSLGAFYLVFATIYVFPVLYLYKFSSHAKKAFIHRDENHFHLSVQNLKILFRLTGIFTIASLVLTFLGLMFAAIISVFAF